MSKDYSIVSFSTSIDGKTRRLFIAQTPTDLRVIGSMVIEVDLTGETGYIYDLYVAPERRRDGVASFMIRTAISDLGNAEKTSAFTCNIKNKNSVSIALFEKLGFKRCMTYEDDSFYYTFRG